MVEYNNHRSGSINKVERIGNTVRRPVHRWTPAVHGLFRHLEEIDFKGVPRLLGVDGEHEVLTFIQGEAGLRPWMEVLKTDLAIEQFAGFLRSYHLAVEDYIQPKDTEWYVPGLKWRPGLIIRHGDLGPWNTVWHDGDLTGVVDALIELQEMEIDRISALGASGIDPWKLFRKRGDSEDIGREKAWLQAEYRNLV